MRKSRHFNYQGEVGVVIIKMASEAHTPPQNLEDTCTWRAILISWVDEDEDVQALQSSTTVHIRMRTAT